jgi:hypothetical protein
MTRLFLVLPLLLLVSVSAHAQDINAELAHCLTMNGAVERLSCYDRVAQGAVRAAPSIAAPAIAPRQAQPAPPRVFGQEQLPKSSAEQDERLTADITAFQADARGRFTVTLSNGQVWQQMAGDSGIAQRGPKSSRTVSISRGSLGSYDLRFSDRNITFKVRRLR